MILPTFCLAKLGFDLLVQQLTIFMQINKNKI